MSNLKISQAEKIKIFLNEYYFGNKSYNSILRIVAGPVILILGFLMYMHGNSKLGIGYSGFIIFYGIYYSLKPFIIIFIQKSRFKNIDPNYQIQSDKIIIQSGKSKSELYYSELENILKRKTYFALKTKSKQGIYLPVRILEAEEIDILDRLKKNQ
ncbi:YcxB family protein [Maribacter sp. ANRC-HE7]|uniref:YcxB family protein n=1 Tax=Maribacter aquimaris TaxID=2737171 RepID=A0ABR7V5A2_9FLAO|nr:YcxB family protein [Maribacter aquimaris]MBD0779978.1 YcxB family protein [Maribacter aquimaris]